jgi:diguanylate cyclase (GGDEF)-like protein
VIAATEIAESIEGQRMGVSYKVLLVDDEEPVRNLIVSLFLKYGHRCEGTEDGRCALNRLARDSFDVVITDVVMPNMDGISLTRELSQLYPNLPVMVMTGHSQEQYAESAMAAGAREFINKPFSVREFVIRFDKMMRDHKGKELLLALSLTDELTGLYNRRRFLVLTEQCLKVAARGKKRSLLLFIDVDNLKGINDRYGHAEGDLALKNLAGVLKKTFRESDIIGRFGGDEFVLLMESADEKSELLITRLHENLDDHNASVSCRYHLSVSVGTALFDPEHPVSIDELLTRADSSMYGQKRRKETQPVFREATRPSD